MATAYKRSPHFIGQRSHAFAKVEFAMAPFTRPKDEKQTTAIPGR